MIFIIFAFAIVMLVCEYGFKKTLIWTGILFFCLTMLVLYDEYGFAGLMVIIIPVGIFALVFIITAAIPDKYEYKETNQWESNKIAKEQQKIKQEQQQRQQDYERGNYYGTFEHTKQTLQSLMKDNNISDFFTFAYLAQNENITNYRKLGYLYENGYGTEEKDYIKAMKCYQKANAWREIGYMHYFGYGVPKNENRARTYFAKCDDREDCKRIISYFERIANNSNDANALCNLGWHYAEGKGISQDYHKALYYYQKAADLGNKIACNNLGNCYEYDKLYVLFSQCRALKYYKKACDLGNQKGCENFRRLKAQMGITNDDDVLF